MCVYACENYDVERQRHSKQINYTQDSSFSKGKRRAALGGIRTHAALSLGDHISDEVPKRTARLHSGQLELPWWHSNPPHLQFVECVVTQLGQPSQRTMSGRMFNYSAHVTVFSLFIAAPQTSQAPVPPPATNEPTPPSSSAPSSSQPLFVPQSQHPTYSQFPPAPSGFPPFNIPYFKPAMMMGAGGPAGVQRPPHIPPIPTPQHPLHPLPLSSHQVMCMWCNALSQFVCTYVLAVSLPATYSTNV